MLLENGGGWYKGKIRFKMEFIPDKPIEPSLSDAVLGGQSGQS